MSSGTTLRLMYLEAVYNDRLLSFSLIHDDERLEASRLSIIFTSQSSDSVCVFESLTKPNQATTYWQGTLNLSVK